MSGWKGDNERQHGVKPCLQLKSIAASAGTVPRPLA